MSTYKIRVERSSRGPVFRWKATVIEQADPDPAWPWPPPEYFWPVFAVTRKGAIRKAHREIRRRHRDAIRAAAAETIMAEVNDG
jgi:hypothetical protein